MRLVLSIFNLKFKLALAVLGTDTNFDAWKSTGKSNFKFTGN